jgi:hypothetical protein
MSEQNLDYAAIRRNVEERLPRQKWTYRTVFFLFHVLFFAISMLTVWGTVAGDSQLQEVLFNNRSGAAVIVILPTILWTAVILFHVASLYIETDAGEKTIRERLLLREVGEDILRKGLMDEGILEKPKRRVAGQTNHMQLSDDGELLTVDEDERKEQRDYNARANGAGAM